MESARWWTIRRAQNRKPATYRCPLCGGYLPALSEHVLLAPEGDTSRRRHAHTRCAVAAREGRRLPTVRGGGGGRPVADDGRGARGLGRVAPRVARAAARQVPTEGVTSGLWAASQLSAISLVVHERPSTARGRLGVR